jgi:hypothetical protein
LLVDGASQNSEQHRTSSFLTGLINTYKRKRQKTKKCINKLQENKNLNTKNKK